MLPVDCSNYTHLDTVLVSWLVLQSQSPKGPARSFWWNYFTLFLYSNRFTSVSYPYRLADCQMLTTSSDNTAWDLKLISVAQKCTCAPVYLPNFWPILSHYLEQVVFICYTAAGSGSLNVQCVTFGWQFCGSKRMQVNIREGLLLWHYNRTSLRMNDTNHETQIQVS